MQFMVFDTQPNLIHRMVRNYENKGPDGVSNKGPNLIHNAGVHIANANRLTLANQYKWRHEYAHFAIHPSLHSVLIEQLLN